MFDIPEENYKPLDTKPRNFLQAELIKIMVPDLNNKDQLVWINKYAKKVSDMIDNSANTEIRVLINDGEYNKAALLIKDILEKESQDLEMQKAA